MPMYRGCVTPQALSVREFGQHSVSEVRLFDLPFPATLGALGAVRIDPGRASMLSNTARERARHEFRAQDDAKP
jgi:hypothetical protein